MARARIQKNLPPRYRKLRAGMNPEHLKMVRQLACLGCGHPAGAEFGDHVTAHHLLRTGERGMGMKSPDKWAVPLHFHCHMNLHDSGDEEKWFSDRGIDALVVAKALWAERGDLEAMRRVVFRARQEAALKLVPKEGIEPPTSSVS